MALPKTTGGSGKVTNPKSLASTRKEDKKTIADIKKEVAKDVKPYVPPVPPTPPVVLPPRANPAPPTTPVVNPIPYVAPLPPPPPPPPPVPPSAQDLGVVKMPGRDVTDLSKLVPVEDADKIKAIFFNNMSALDLAQTLDAKTIDGVVENYSIISNPSEVRRRYDASKNLTIMDKLAPISGVFDINLDSKIPGESYIINNNLNNTYQYIDENDNLVTVQKNNLYIASNGDLVIEFENIRDDEIIQVQIDSNGTIYEVTN